MQQIFSSGQKIKDVHSKSSGVILLQQIPAHLNPKMLPLGSISKTDSNNGVDAEWTKVVFHIYKEKTYL